MPRTNSKQPSRTRNLKSLVPLLLDWFRAHARDLPWRRTRDPYAIWVSEIMLQQTQVKTVIPYWERWLRELPTIESLAGAAPEKIHKLWEGLGYYTRVRNMQKAAQQIVARHNGMFPTTFDDVLGLSGIGRYTAGAICSIAYNQATPIVDGNVIRVLTRIFGIETNARDKDTQALLWDLAHELVSHAKAAKVAKKKPSRPQRPLREACSHLNQSLMELGALICAPRDPNCAACPVRRLCIARRENRTSDLPNLGKRIAATHRRFAAFVVRHEDRFLVRQRPAGVVNAHLWEFPNIELPSPAAAPAASARQALGFAPKELLPICTIKHSITRYRITLEAFTAAGDPGKAVGEWVRAGDLEKLSFPSAHKKILAAAIRS
jgi:A/G-specific adenine glycosylase